MTIFSGTDAASNSLSGSNRVGKVPFQVFAITNAIENPWGYPATCSFVWGDGSGNTTVLASLSSGTTYGGLTFPGVCAAFHTYSAAGNYLAFINVSSSSGAFHSDSYPVQAYSSTPTFAIKWRSFIEGQGVVSNLTRQTYAGQPIMAFIYNNASYPITEPTGTWYMDSWANPIFTFDAGASKIIYPGGYFPFAWPGNVPQVITAAGSHQFWVKTNCFGCSVNSTSPKMTVVYSNAQTLPSMTAVETKGIISNIQPSTSVLNPIKLTNTGSFTIAFTDVTQNTAPTGTNAVVAGWDPVTLYNQYGPVINKTIQTYISSPWFAQSPVDHSAALANLGLLIQPGETVTVHQEIFNPSPISMLSSSGAVTTTFLPYAAASCSAVGACSVSGPQVVATIPITTGGPTPASIQTGYGQQVGNGSVVLVGYVNSMGTSTAIQTWFQFIVPNGTTYTTNTQLATGPSTIKYYLQGLPTGNYSLTMFGTTSLGQNLNGGIVTFTVGIASSGNPAANAGGWTQGFLYGIAGAAGMPALFIGLVIGMMVLFGAIGFLLFLQGAFDTQVPAIVWLPMLVILMGVNVALFLWPDWLALLSFAVIGLLLWQSLSEGGGIGGGEPSG